ncbi:MAG: hypothetical protein P8Y97_11480 [Candidatus Lokiarchaeota archaeon]
MIRFLAYMSKKSFFDWEKQFRPQKKQNSPNMPKKVNSLGIKPEEYKKFLKMWVRKNIHEIEK